MSTRLNEPPARLPTLESGDVRAVPSGTRVCRIYTRIGAHPTRPDQLRAYGPVPTARFDHHAPPPRLQQDVAAGYYGVVSLDGAVLDATRPVGLDPEAGVAIDSPVVTAVAETFQVNRTVVLSDRQALAIGTLLQPYQVLDLGSAWATRAGAGNHLSTGPHPVTRRWAQAIRAGYPQLDGVYWHSSVHPPGRVLMLNERAADRQGIVPMRLVYDEPLDGPFTRLLLAEVRTIIGSHSSASQTMTTVSDRHEMFWHGIPGRVDRDSRGRVSAWVP